MTSRRTPAPGSRAAARGRPAPPAPRRWPLALAGVALAAAGAYWLTAEPPAAGSKPREAGPPRDGLRQAPAEPARREARPATAPPPPPGRDRSITSSEPVDAEESGEELSAPAPAIDLAEAPETESSEQHAQAAAVPPPEAAEAPQDEAPQDEAPERAARPRPRARRLQLTLLRRWTTPGLCPRADQASEAQRTLMSHFRAAELGAGARVFLDPRLPAGAEQPALQYLEEAQRVLRAELQLSPGVPDVFLYSDVHLLLASACTNADVVAYYDGALHIVVTRDDVRESVLHEFTHHALMTAGVLGPAWVQEGMAMHIAGETWWRRHDLLQQLIERPFGLSTMETIVPYTLESEQAVLFYAQAAAMVECATREPESTLSELLSELDVQQSAEALEYGLPALAELSALRECMKELLQEPAKERREQR